MKKSLFLTTYMFLALGPFFLLANENEKVFSCDKQVKRVVDQLEMVIVRVDGITEGDWPERTDITPLSSTSSNDKNINYSAIVYHHNDVGDKWTQNYEVTLNASSCQIVTYKFLGFR